MVRLAFKAEQAEATVRDLHRATVLLDRAMLHCEEPAERGICIAVGNRLVDLAEQIETALLDADRVGR